jgi:hypothetical protein
MSQLSPSDIKEHVREVLRHAAHGKGERPNFLTVYQILERLPAEIKARLISERGCIGGQGAGESYSAASVVAQAAQLLAPDVVVEYLDSQELLLRVNGETITPGNEVCAVYRVVEIAPTANLLGSVTFSGDIIGPFHDEWHSAS